MFYGNTLKLISISTSSLIASYNVELANVSMLFDRLSQSSIKARESEFVVTMSAQ